MLDEEILQSDFASPGGIPGCPLNPDYPSVCATSYVPGDLEASGEDKEDFF